MYVNDVYGAPTSINGLQLTIATVFFAFQIYCDFSGYSDIAIGSARVMGFRLMENFDRPYLSRSITEFWQRWHISLSTWFRDYVYIPLGGNRVGPARFTRICSSRSAQRAVARRELDVRRLGPAHGFYLIVGDATRPLRERLLGAVALPRHSRIRAALAVASTFTLTCVAWIIFRATSPQDAVYIMTHLLSDWNFNQIATEQFLLRQMPVAIGSIVALEVIQWMNSRRRLIPMIGRLSMPARWTVYATFVVGVILFGVYRQTQFIYFQF